MFIKWFAINKNFFSLEIIMPFHTIVKVSKYPVRRFCIEYRKMQTLVHDDSQVALKNNLCFIIKQSSHYLALNHFN